jgi:hypothetical protein
MLGSVCVRVCVCVNASELRGMEGGCVWVCVCVCVSECVCKDDFVRNTHKIIQSENQIIFKPVFFMDNFQKPAPHFFYDPICIATVVTLCRPLAPMCNVRKLESCTV